MSSVIRQRQSLMFRARSYTSFVIMPRAPIMEWLSDLDASLESSRGFFAGYPIVVDLSAVTLSPNGISELLASLADRNIRVLGVEGIDPSAAAPGLPPILRPGRGSEPVVLPQGDATPAVPAPPQMKVKEPQSLMIEDPVRSGQTIVFTEGDITVLGSVGSGAEVVAGGSIHIYGTLRGRAMAGATGNGRARIFCHRVEAELLAIAAGINRHVAVGNAQDFAQHTRDFKAVLRMCRDPDQGADPCGGRPVAPLFVRRVKLDGQAKIEKFPLDFEQPILARA